MSISIGMAGLFVLLAAAALFFYKPLLAKLRRPQPSALKAGPEGPTHYRAVSISYDEHACQAAKELSDEKYLTGSTPRLPLQNCDLEQCSCRYVHHDDRRNDVSERRDLKQNETEEDERRNANGRRRTDWRQH